MKRRLLRLGLWLLGIAVLVVALGAGGFLVFLNKFNPAPPALDYPHPANALEAQRQDLDYFGKLVAMDRAFSPAARQEADRRLAALRALPTALDRGHFRVALMEIVALADNGHTRLGPSQKDSQQQPELPIRVTLFADGLYVMRAQDADADLLGAKVEAVDGIPVADVLKRLETLRGGIAAWRRFDAVSLIHQQDILFGLGIAHAANASEWTFVTPAGSRIVRRLDAYTPAKAEPLARPSRWLSVEPFKGLDKGWKGYVPPGFTAPTTFQAFDTAFREVRLSGSCAVLVQMKGMLDLGGQHIADFLQATEADLMAHKPCAVILDLRYDGGGNYTNFYDFANRLPGMIAPGGRIYLLTGPQTFSAAITSTAFVKQAGGARVTILGEPVGDRLKFYAEGNRGCLPNYQLCFGYQTGLHDYQHPCNDLDRCFWLNYFYPVRVDTLEPDETMTLSFADWSAGHDPVFERAVALANAK